MHSLPWMMATLGQPGASTARRNSLSHAHPPSHDPSSSPILRSETEPASGHDEKTVSTPLVLSPNEQVTPASVLRNRHRTPPPPPPKPAPEFPTQQPTTTFPTQQPTVTQPASLPLAQSSPVLAPTFSAPPKKAQTELWLSLKLRLDGINHVEQTFEVNGWLNMWWLDPIFESRPEVTRNYEEAEVSRTSGHTGNFMVADDRSNQPINLQSMFENAIKCELIEPPVFRYNSNTQVVSETIHFAATLSEELELDRFPFDRQYLTLRLCLRTTKYVLLSEPPSYVPNGYDMRTMVSYTCSPSIAGWTGKSPVVGFCRAAGQSDDLRITFSLRMERHFTFWLYNVVFLMFCIVSLTPMTFSIPPDAIADRMSIILTLLLTIVTFKFMILSEIPKTSTITLFDKYLFAAYGMLFFAVAQTILCWMLPVTLWTQMNWISAFGMGFTWIAFHMWIVRNAFVGSFSVPWSDMKDEGGVGFRHSAILVEDKDVLLPDEPDRSSRLLAQGSMATVLDQALK